MPGVTWRRARAPVLVLGLSLAHAVLVGMLGAIESPNADEIGHLAAGISIWELGRCDRYCVNPPLVRALAAIPVLACRPATSWRDEPRTSADRSEWRVGVEFVERNGWKRASWYFTIARWACIPFSIMGGWVCYRWASDLYGRASGVLAIVMFYASPNVIAWGATICPDVPAAATGVSAAYVFWRWLAKPAWTAALKAGLMLGVAELTKMTWIVLFVVWPALCVLRIWGSARKPWFPLLVQLAAILLLALYVLNVGYGFRGTCERLSEFQFFSHTLAGSDSVSDGGRGGNRFRDSVLGAIPVPIPKDYLKGMDLQKLDFELGKWSYLCGEWKRGGWWYYYVVCAILKVPLGTWVLGLLAIGVSMRRAQAQSLCGTANYPGPCRGRLTVSLNEISLLAHALAVFAIVCSETGFSCYFRYILPAFPFAFIWISKVAKTFTPGDKLAAEVICLPVVWSVLSSAWVFPHSLSYFNELAGGPCGGQRYLLDANVDWGQDMGRLKQWYDGHADARPFVVSVRSLLSPQIIGIHSPHMQVEPRVDNAQAVSGARKLNFRPGWYAISVHFLHDPQYRNFFAMEPVDSIGYTVYIYHVTMDDVNRVRQTQDYRGQGR
ncbi:MAG: ArnT family glycosyltransferase [Thermoguttaceae bacterium]